MRINRLMCGLVLVCGLEANAQTTLSFSQWRGMALQLTAKLESGGSVSAVKIAGGVTVGPPSHRFIWDRTEKRFFGYDVEAEPAGEAALQIRIVPQKLSSEELAKLGVDASWTRLGPVRYPAIPPVRVGDTVTIDLLVNPSTGQKIVDYILVKSSGDRPMVPNPPETSRDFSAADAMLQVTGPSVWANGKLVGHLAAPGGLGAAAVWFYLPEKGRYIMTLAPNAELGFRRAGRAARSLLTFNDEGVAYKIECPGRIVPGEGVFNLYMLHQPGWRPKGGDADAPFLIGGADKPEWVIGK